MNTIERRRYPSDVTDAEWAILEPLVPAARPGPNPQKHTRREIVNAIFYKLKSGCQWRNLPHDLPPWHTVSDYFYKWRDDCVLDDILPVLNRQARVAMGRESTPSVGIVDSQSVKSSHGGEAIGIDGGKRVRGRKRSILTDTKGLIMAVVVTAANVPDRNAYRELAHAARVQSTRIEKILVDSAYNGDAVRLAERETRIVAEVSQRPDGTKGFVPEVCRWRVERTLGWLGYTRQLNREYDRTVASSEAWVKFAACRIALRNAT